MQAQSAFNGGACFHPRWCELLVCRPLRDVRVDHFSYPTRTRSLRCIPVPVPNPRLRFLPQITLRGVTPTIVHLEKAILLLYLYLVALNYLAWSVCRPLQVAARCDSTTSYPPPSPAPSLSASIYVSEVKTSSEINQLYCHT